MLLTDLQMPETEINMDAPAQTDLIHFGEKYVSSGISPNLARRLLDNGLDMGCMRPYLVPAKGRYDTFNARSYITRNAMNPRTGKMEAIPIRTNNDTNAVLRFLDWIQLDEAIIKAAKPRLRAARDLEEMGLVYMLPNGIAKTTMQYQQQSDITGATMSMDGLRMSEADRPVFSQLDFPLPLIHKDFNFPLRQLLASRTGFSPLDTTTAELAGRRVAEQVEQLVLGAPTSTLLLGVPTYQWNSANVYGYMNFPNRITYSIVQPTTVGWIPQNTVDDVLQMKKICQQTDYHFGPWMLYAGLYWDPYLDDDYKPTYNDTTLRQRLREIDGILDVRTVDYIPDDSLIMVQQTTDVVRLVKGMDITTVQWESHGGMQMNFKVMCLILPQLRTDINLLTGIVHGS